MPFATTDLSDAHPGAVILAPGLRDFGGRPRFQGPAVTLRLEDDNVLLRATLEEPGLGRVLVVDNGGRMNCALLGAMLAGSGVRQGWAGIVLDGCVRDVAELAGLDIGIRALAAHPRRSGKLGRGERDVPVTVAGGLVRPGDHVYADQDGVVVLPKG